MLTSLRYIETEREVRERTRRLALTQDAIIQSLAALAETRHHETGGHIQRTRHYMRALAMRLKDHPRFRHYLDDTTIDLLFRLAPLHDIGKVGVPDQILLKPARLTMEEYSEMKKHTLYGSETIRMARNFLGEDSFLQVADEIALNHHERWDGSGYPRGLRGNEIPIPGRLMAAADSYDAIISPRLYKPAISHKEAIRLIRNLRGVYFDPDVVDAFLEVSDEFAEIASRFASSGVEPEPPKGCDISRMIPVCYNELEWRGGTTQVPWPCGRPKSARTKPPEALPPAMIRGFADTVKTQASRGAGESPAATPCFRLPLPSLAHPMRTPLAATAGTAIHNARESASPLSIPAPANAALRCPTHSGLKASPEKVDQEDVDGDARRADARGDAADRQRVHGARVAEQEEHPEEDRPRRPIRPSAPRAPRPPRERRRAAFRPRSTPPRRSTASAAWR